VAHVCKYPISLANGAYIINDVRLLSNPLVKVASSRQKEENEECSGLMNPDTNIGGKVTTLIEVPDDQKTTFLYS